MSELEIRHLTKDDVASAERQFALLFGEPESAERSAAEIEPLAIERCVGAFDEGRVVGHVGVIPMDISVPGGPIDLCAITLVFVDTTHRRQGIGKQIMLKAMEEATEPIAALWASRPGFYEHLGFEPAIASTLCTITSDDVVSLRSNTPRFDRVIRADDALAAKVLPEIYAKARAYRPGMTSRDEAWWERRFIGDAEWRRFGSAELQTVVAYRGEEPVAYAIYGLKANFDQLGPNHTLNLKESIGVDGPAEAAMMTWLCQVDLVGKVEAHWRPMDDPFIQCLVQRRHVHAQLTEGLYLRILDVEKALTARTYFADISFTARVHDADLARNDGTWAITLGSSGTSVTKVEETIPIDIELDIRGLAGIFLGGYSLSTMIGAGLITVHNRDLLLPLHQAFSSPTAPWNPEVW